MTTQKLAKTMQNNMRINLQFTSMAREVVQNIQLGSPNKYRISTKNSTNM